jgi:succinoglycan biosynthesis protein ExoM
MINPIPHIYVGVCTYKRPKLLDNLLRTLKNQVVDGLLTYSINIVDNDFRESAKGVVIHHQAESLVPIRYFVESEQNISLARNRAIQNADGQFFAGIDDDEFAGERWLADLYLAMQKYSADGALGPVLPSFEIEPPRWVIRGKFFHRKMLPTGSLLKDLRQMRTGNFMISRKVIQENGSLFDPALGKTGGEDVDFFRRMLERNYRFIWSNEAKVYETVPAERLRRSYLLKRALLRGVVSARHARLLSFNTAKSLVAVLLYTSGLPFLVIFWHHEFMRYLIKDCDHIGKIMARCGVKLISRRSD